MFHIHRDGSYVRTVPNEEALMRWFHTQHSYSMDHAVRYEGYRILDSNSREVTL